MKYTLKTLFSGMTLVLIGLILSGCPKAKGPGPEAEAPVEEPTVDQGVESPAPGSVLDVGTEWSTAPAVFGTVNFEYMQADLTLEARTQLKENASILKAVLKASPGVKIRVEGHCDERGTLEYNMALGERRAKALRDYYTSLGVARSTLSTISYGEERPVCTEVSEDCWARNRRGETTLKASAPVKIPLAN